MLLLIGGWRRGFALLAVAALTAVLALNLNAVNSEKYRTLLNENTYVTGSVLGIRLSIWGSTLDIVKERALTGYGYGWKKLSNAIQDGGFVERWSVTRPTEVASGKVLGYGGANPHNLVLQILFEIGAAGLLLYLLCWISWLNGALRPLLGSAIRAAGAARLLLTASLGVAVSFWSINLTNGYWEGSIANTLICWLCLSTLMSRAAQGAKYSGEGSLPADFNGRILVIRRDNIGDLVCTTPLLRLLRMRFPHAWIGALVNRYNEDVLAGNPDLDALFSYRKAKHREAGESALAIHWARLRQLIALRRRNIDIALLPASGGQASARQMAKLIGARRIIEQAADRGATMHEVERAARVLAPLGISDAPPPLRVCADAQGVAAVRARVAATIPGDGPLLGLHISARKPDQRWPAQHFIDLIARLHGSHGARVMLFWSPGTENNPLHPGDDRKAATIADACHSPLLPWPTTGLRALIDGIAVCDGIICSDGGAMHIAAGLGKPIVCLFGSSDPAIWRPWAVPHRVLRAASRRAADITVEEVAAAWEQVTA
jgi:ADP-heptose:LPS heptosyltransferase